MWIRRLVTVLAAAALGMALMTACTSKQPTAEDYKSAEWVRGALIGSWAQKSSVPIPYVFKSDGTLTIGSENHSGWTITPEGEFAILSYDGKRQGAVVFVDGSTWRLWRGSVNVPFEDVQKGTVSQEYYLSNPFSRM